MNILAIGPLEIFSFLFLYGCTLIFLMYWLFKMLKNSNENLKVTREILERLKNNPSNDQSSA